MEITCGVAVWTSITFTCEPNGMTKYWISLRLYLNMKIIYRFLESVIPTIRPPLYCQYFVIQMDTVNHSLICHKLHLTVTTRLNKKVL